MPNYCSNQLEIKGEQKEIARFKQNAHSNEGKFLENLYPMPSTIDLSNSTIKNGNMPDWYNWRIENWGTKWDVDADLIFENETTLNYSFESAWSPPVDALQHISKDYPDLIFNIKFEEEGNDFIGYSIYQNGNVLKQVEGTYNEHASYSVKIENATIRDDILHVTMLVSYKKDKWNLESLNKEHHLIQVKAESTNGYINFDEAGNWEYHIENAEYIINDAFNNYFEDNLSYYFQENREQIKLFIEKTYLEKELIEINKKNDLTLKI